MLPDPELTEYAYALAKADRYQEALDVLDLLANPNTPRALNYRGYATRKLGRTDEGIGYYLKSVALDPAYPQVREYLGEAYVIEGKYDLAKAQLATIEKLCGKDCEYYEDLAEALTTRTRFRRGLGGARRAIAARVFPAQGNGWMSHARSTREAAVAPSAGRAFDADLDFLVALGRPARAHRPRNAGLHFHCRRRGQDRGLRRASPPICRRMGLMGGCCRWSL